jgi:2'-hydroxyisoflavone reductase
MRILILGGTVFLGRALVDAAQARSHTLTLFNRGQTNPDLFSAIEQIHGDRMADLDRLAGRTWDVALDVKGLLPGNVGRVASMLSGAIGQYIFVSTLSVYADVSQPGYDERAPVAELPPGASADEMTDETYGPLKALCERAAEAAMPGRVLVVRPGLIVGPHDPTDRFTYWPWRVARGGDVLAPGSPDRPLQFIDVRDLAEWTIRLAEQRAIGTFNAVGPAGMTTMGGLLETCREVGGRDQRFVWMDDAFLLDRKVRPWIELPLWVPEIDPQFAGILGCDSSRALAAGLTIRPVAETVRATLEWIETLPPDHTWRAGMQPDREVELLAAWRSRH